MSLAKDILDEALSILSKNLTFKVVTSNLNDYNSGHSHTPNNARFTGQSPCYVVFGSDGDDYVAFTRKQDVEMVADYATKHWKQTGDLETAFINNWEKLGYKVDLNKFKSV